MGRVEIMTGRERRRIWSDEQKLAILSEVVSADASIVEIARRHDIVPQQIYSWRKQFGLRRHAEPQPSEATFLPVTVVAPDDHPSQGASQVTASRRPAKPSRIEIVCKGGRTLKVEADIAADLLKALIRSVEEA